MESFSPFAGNTSTHLQFHTKSLLFVALSQLFAEFNEYTFDYYVLNKTMEHFGQCVTRFADCCGCRLSAVFQYKVCNFGSFVLTLVRFTTIRFIYHLLSDNLFFWAIWNLFSCSSCKKFSFLRHVKCPFCRPFATKNTSKLKVNNFSPNWIKSIIIVFDVLYCV